MVTQTCQAYQQRIEALEDKKWDLEQEVADKDHQVCTRPPITRVDEPLRTDTPVLLHISTGVRLSGRVTSSFNLCWFAGVQAFL